MTREEAIDVLSDFHKFTLSILGKSIYAERCSALDMAIEALQTDLVRCKECRHWQKTNIETIDGEPIYDCPFCGEWADANGFCSFGERRE